MAGLRRVKLVNAFLSDSGACWDLLTNFFLRTSCVFVIRVGTPGPVCQIATIARAVDTEAGVVSETVVSCSTAGLMAKSIVAAWDKAVVQLLPSRSIARSIANEGVRITHRIERILAGVRCIA